MRMLKWPFTGLLLLIAALQIAAFLAILKIDAIREQSRLLVSVAAAHETRAKGFESTTYLATVGLAAADWEMLLEQRSAAAEITKAFERTTKALLAGGRAPLGNGEVEVTKVDDPEIAAALTAASASWKEMVAAHVRVLRSENRSLKANPDLERFRRVSHTLMVQLRKVSELLHQDHVAETRHLDEVQRAIPLGALLLSALMGLFVFQRIIVPFGVSMDELREREGELRAARDLLEARVEERTAALGQANDELRHQTEILDSMLQNMGDGVLVTDAQGRFVLRNAMASQLLDVGHADVTVERWYESHACIMADGTTPFSADKMPLFRAVQGEAPEQVEMLIKSLDRPKGLWLSITGRPLHGRDGTTLRGSVMVLRDVTLRKQAEEAMRRAHDELEHRVKERTEELKNAQRRSLDLARQAGMAELASNMLHNVGNVLNSLNTSTTVLGERVRALRVDTLSNLASVVEGHRSDLASFLVDDERGRLLPDLLTKLGQRMARDQDEMRDMVEALYRHVEHIRGIVRLQQNYATSSDFVEAISIEELVGDAMRISAAALGRHQIRFEQHIEKLPRLLADKHKLLQILLNLISNAKYAVDGNDAGDRRVSLRIDKTPDHRVRIEVRDNGMGIAAELMTKIFQHGFTTRKEGHGFGLHSSAIAARAMGGSLEVQSNGVGKGAAFTLLFPYRPEVLDAV